MLQAERSPFRAPDEVDIFNLPKPSSRTMALVSTQSLTEMSTRNLPGGKQRPPRMADNLDSICEPNVENVGTSTSRKLKGLHCLYRNNFIFVLYMYKFYMVAVLLITRIFRYFPIIMES
jgi:hypothetical protein